MRTKIIIIGFLLASVSFSISAQLAMGKWRTHLAYNSVSQIAQSENKIFAVSQGALFSVSKQDGSLEFYSKLNGLSSSNITQIEYDSSNKQLLIVYSNGNIDVLGTGGVTNIPDLYNKQMSASKNVNHILFYQNKAFLACDFGIVVLNLAKNEVADTYYIGANASEVKVLNTTIFNGSIYALSNSVVYQASVTEPNLVNYQFWTTATGFPGAGDFQKIASFAGKLVLLRGGKLYKQESDKSWTPFATDVTATDFNISNNNLSIFAGTSTYLVDALFNVKAINNLGTLTDAEYDAQGNTYYFAANSLGIISYKQVSNETPAINYFKPAGPAVNKPWKIVFSGKKLFMVPGGRWAAFYMQPGYIMMFEDNSWSNIDHTSIESNTGVICQDLVSIAVDPVDKNHFFAASYSSGLYEFKENKFFKYHNFTNSTIENLFGSYQYQMLDGTIFDKDGNLWFLNSYASKSIKVLLKDGKWSQLEFGTLKNMPTLQDILISNQNPNLKWVTSVRPTVGVFIFDDNGTITDQSDDKSIFLTSFLYPEVSNTGNTVLVAKFPGAIYSIAQDKNGVVWVGTDIGPFQFNTTSKFNPTYIASRVKIPRGDSTNLADYLLANEKIKAIAIDGANRKWLGTETSGVYLMSENGQQTIQHFTTTNSPLLSNNILSIAINPITGETFFGTDQGLISYQSDASEAGETFGNVYAYPNPVRQNYTGLITITGLVEKTQVKITDINGNLVCETVSNGSLATWDGKDVHGRRVNTGIYLAICANADGTQSAITKILVIN